MNTSEDTPEAIGEMHQLLAASFHSTAGARTVLHVDENYPDSTKQSTTMSTEPTKDTSETLKESSETPNATGSENSASGAAGEVKPLSTDDEHGESSKHAFVNPSQEHPEDSVREIPEELPEEFFKSMQKPEILRSESAGKVAQRKVQAYHSASKLVKPERKGSVQMLSWKDIELGRLLDKGSFSCVYEATLSSDKVDPKPVYAVKYLKENVTEQEDTLVTGAVDLALEANILSNLMHVNVIRVHGYRSGCISQSFGQQERGFFLVLDLLYDTCDKRLDRWRRERIGIDTRRIRERIEDVALGIADGMAYIHSRNIIFRDLKPQNIGFNEEGEVKIFDFGLARETDSLGNIRQMTGNAGTPRYMSPEIARNENYGFSSDVYSFSILLWEIVTLGKPFDSIKSLPQFNEEVVRRHQRPPLKKVNSAVMRALLQQCWDKDQDQRPTFTQVQQALQEYLAQSEPKPPVFRRYLSSLSTSGKGGESSRHSGSIQTQPTSSVMSSRRTVESDHEAKSRSPRLLSWLSFSRKKRDASERPVVESPTNKERTWVQRKLLRRPNMHMDLSHTEYRIRKYDLGRPGSFRSSGSIHSSDEFKQSRRMSGNSAMSRRSSGSAVDRSQRRRSSSKGGSNIEAMAAALAAETKSNRQFLREMKRADKKSEKKKAK